MKNTKRFITVLLIAAAAVLTLAGCSQKNKSQEEAREATQGEAREAAQEEAREVANGILTAFQEQDADALDRYFPDAGIGNLVYSDKPGFKMYTEKMSWKIEKTEEGKSGYQVVISVENVDMIEILRKNPPVEGAQLPDPLPEQIAQTGTKKFEYTMPLKKGENGYLFDMGEEDEQASLENLGGLLNVITGGGYDYLAAQAETD